MIERWIDRDDRYLDGWIDRYRNDRWMDGYIEKQIDNIDGQIDD